MLYVARDKNKTLDLFTTYPTRLGCGCWFNYEKEGRSLKIDEKLFKRLKWEDEPVEVVIISKEEYESLKKNKNE